MRRLRAGECVAGAGAAALLGSLFAGWFGPSGETGWSALGWLTLAFCAAAIAVGAWLPVATVANRPLAQQVAAAVLAAAVAPFAFGVLALRVLVFQPGDNAITTLRYGSWLGLAALLLIAIGGWWAIKDERTDAPESAYTPPAPRPAPPARS